MQGKHWSLQASGVGSGAFTTVAAQSNTDLTIQNTDIDATTKDSQGFKERFAPGAITDLKAKVDCISDLSTAQTFFLNSALSGNHTVHCRLVDGINGLFYEADFLVTATQMTGKVEGFVTLNLSLDSTGVVTSGTNAAFIGLV